MTTRQRRSHLLSRELSRRLIFLLGQKSKYFRYILCLTYININSNTLGISVVNVISNNQSISLVLEVLISRITLPRLRPSVNFLSAACLRVPLMIGTSVNLKSILLFPLLTDITQATVIWAVTPTYHLERTSIPMVFWSRENRKALYI